MTRTTPPEKEETHYTLALVIGIFLGHLIDKAYGLNWMGWMP